MIRKAFVMQVNPDAHEEYQRRHNPIWPELEAVLKSHGAHNYAIYLDKARNLLFATVEIESEERWNAVASTDVCQRWWKYMTDVMPANPDNSPVSRELQEVFYLPQLPNVPEMPPAQYFKFRFEKLNILHLPVSYISLIHCE